MQHEGRLAGAVRPEQRDPFAARDREVHAEQGLMAVGIGEGEAGDLQGSSAHGIHPTTAGEGVGIHSVHPTTHTASAAAGRAKAYDHWARVAVTSSITGIAPAYPRLIMARCTRSPRS